MHSLADSVSEISFTAFSTQREDGADVHAYTQPIFPSSLPAANATKKKHYPPETFTGSPLQEIANLNSLQRHLGPW